MQFFSPLMQISNLCKTFGLGQGRPQGRGRDSPQTEKIVVEKWCYFPEPDKITKVLEDRREKWVKNQISTEIFICKS